MAAAAAAAAAASAQNGQDVKLTAHLPVLLSERHPTYQRWRTAFNNYCDCFAPLQAARNIAIAVPYASYTAAQKASNSRCRLILQDALSAEDWDLVAGDERYSVNLHQLNTVYTAASEADVELLQFELVNLSMAPGERLKAYWSRGISIRRRLQDLLVPVTDTTLIMWLMAGLPPAWKTYRSIARHNDAANRGVYEMLQFLQPEETSMLKEELASKKTGRHGNSAAQPQDHASPQEHSYASGPDHSLPLPPPFSAHTARYPVFSANTARGPFTGVCWRCNQPGHRSAECQKPSAICTNCGKPGHSVDNCYFIHGFPGRERPPAREQQRPRSRSRSPGPARQGTPGPSRNLQHLSLPAAPRSSS
jgi:hypothetical protein